MPPDGATVHCKPLVTYATMDAMRDIDRAINSESWEWLDLNFPELATAVKRQALDGRTPDEISHYVMKQTQRPAIALRCKQAAAYWVEAGE